MLSSPVIKINKKLMSRGPNFNIVLAAILKPTLTHGKYWAEQINKVVFQELLGEF